MQMLAGKGADLDAGHKRFDPDSPRGGAIRCGQPAAVEWLLKKEVPCSGLALVYAVRHDNTPARSSAVCQVLLQNGVQDSNAHALFEAARCGYAEVVQLLLKPGAGAPQTPAEQMFRWEVALCGAASMGRVDVVKALLEAQPAVPARSAVQPVNKARQAAKKSKKKKASTSGHTAAAGAHRIHPPPLCRS
jgi:hypothetical protein